MKNSFGLRLAVLGPLENADLVGLDLTLDIHKTIIPELSRSDGPILTSRLRWQPGGWDSRPAMGFRAWTEDEMSALRQSSPRTCSRSATESMTYAIAAR